MFLFPTFGHFSVGDLSRKSKNIFLSELVAVQERLVGKVSNIQECVHAASEVNRREGGKEGGKEEGSSSNSIVIFIAFARENAKVECENL